MPTIYDFADKAPRIGSSIIPFLVATVGLFILKTVKLSQEGQTKKIVIGLFATLFGMIMGFWILNLSDFFATKKMYRPDQTKIASGQVSNLNVVNVILNDHMDFYINGIHFDFRTRDLTHYGCTYPDLEPYRISGDDTLTIYFIPKGLYNLVLRVDRR